MTKQKEYFDKEYLDLLFNSFYGPNSALRAIIREDLKQIHKHRHLRNPKPKTYGPTQRKRA
ncbi:MAG: hypothetical protein II238_00540 [Alphaproteobacteria bacterium]|nr:hypothetical protein [Alphaproteobacteria bacterium]